MKLRWPIISLLVFILFRPPLIESQGNKIWIGPTDIDISPSWATQTDFDGPFFVFCRGYYEQSRYEEGVWGWWVDYPGADYNFLVRLSESTKVKVRLGPDHQPVYVVVRLDSPLLFHCPILFLSDVGTIELTENEVTNLRHYLKKGGFLWADDFWGSQSWEHWEHQIRQVLPPELYPMIDIPPTHPIMSQLFYVPSVPQIPNMLFWYRTGKQTSERGEDSQDVHFRGIKDKKGRLVVVMTHNTDIADTWEREGFDTIGEYSYEFTSLGYALGINIFLYALTH